MKKDKSGKGQNTLFTLFVLLLAVTALGAYGLFVLIGGFDAGAAGYSLLLVAPVFIIVAIVAWKGMTNQNRSRKAHLWLALAAFGVIAIPIMIDSQYIAFTTPIGFFWMLNELRQAEIFRKKEEPPQA